MSGFEQPRQARQTFAEGRVDADEAVEIAPSRALLDQRADDLDQLDAPFSRGKGK